MPNQDGTRGAATGDRRGRDEGRPGRPRADGATAAGGAAAGAAGAVPGASTLTARASPRPGSASPAERRVGERPRAMPHTDDAGRTGPGGANVGTRAKPDPGVPQPSMGDPMSFGPGSEETLTAVLARYERIGYTGQFSARPDGKVRCSACGNDIAAKDVTLVALHRLEGASDPDDMMAAAALECPCGHKGTITLTYGPLAPPGDGLLLRAFMDERGGSGIRPGI